MGRPPANSPALAGWFTDDAIPPTCVLSSGVTALGGRAPTLNSDDPPYLEPGGPGASRGAQGDVCLCCWHWPLVAASGSACGSPIATERYQ